MGNSVAPANATPSFKALAISGPFEAILPKDVLFLIVGHVDDLVDFYSCMRVCKAFYNFCNTDAMWTLQLQRFADAQFPGRSQWRGYQLVPVFAEEEWKQHTDNGVQIGTLQMARVDLGLASRKTLFQVKRVIRERFDLYTGWGSLLHTHFIEGFFYRGSLVLGTLYDVQSQESRIVYTGFLYKGRRHGSLGISYYPEGSMSYKGPWVWDLPEGVGKSFWKNGSVQYEGSFKAGKKEGLGTQHWATGRYEGEWRNDVPHGRGCWVWKDGSKFVGCMKDGKRDGFGILFYASDELRTSSSFLSQSNGGINSPVAKDNLRSSTSSSFLSQSNGGINSSHSNVNIQYVGMWSNDLLNGADNEKYARNGRLVYKGGYLDGLKHGRGTAFNKNTGHKSYDGEYLAGKKEGFGVAYGADGVTVVYEGHWREGLFHGPGAVVDPSSGKKISGEWRRGHLQQSQTQINLDDSRLLEASFCDSSGDEEDDVEEKNLE